MKSSSEILSQAHTKFKTILSRASEVTIEIDEYPWDNSVYVSTHFRRAHVQYFVSGGFHVLHVTVFPCVTDIAPIFGFDVVATEKRPIGCYIDLSPVCQDVPWRNSQPFSLECKAELPDWATCFSTDFIGCVLHDEKELEYVLEYGIVLLDSYLLGLGENTGKKSLITVAQSQYCEQQQQNEKTLQVLGRVIGEDKAKEYMETMLFPCP